MTLRAFFILLLGVSLTGCASYRTQVDPAANLGQYRRVWVKSNLNDNHSLDRLLVQVLSSHGYEAQHGPLTMMPREMQAIVTYRDRWTWDFKNHMTSLELTIQDVRSEAQVATASFVGPASLTLSPRDVVERLIRDLHNAKPVVLEATL